MTDRKVAIRKCVQRQHLSYFRATAIGGGPSFKQIVPALQKSRLATTEKTLRELLLQPISMVIHENT